MIAPGSAPPEGPGTSLADAAMVPRARHILSCQLQAIGDQFGKHFHGMITEAARALSRRATIESDPCNADDLELAAKRLPGQSGACLAAFLGDIETQMAGLRAPRVSRSLEDLVPPGGGLVLVETTEMDESSELAGIAARTESRNTLALQLLGYRYGVLAAGPAFDAEHLPVGPIAACHAVRHAANALALPLIARLALYQQFEKAVLAHYPALLDTLNNRLADDGILPHLSFVPIRLPTETASPHEGRGHAQTRAAQPPHPARMVADLTGSSDEPGFLHLQSLLQHRRKLLAKLRPGISDDRVREPLSSEDVHAALRRLRSAGGRPVSIADARQTLLAQARQARGHGVTLSETDADVFELMSLYATQLQRELRPGSPGEQWTSRLLLPALQAGLRDHRVFSDSAHPVRMLLDAVSLAGARWLADDDLDAQALGLLQRAVGAVCEDADAAVESFLATNHALQSGLQSAHRKQEMAERRQVEAARGRERLQLARRRAAEEIASVVAGRQLPRFNTLLLEQAWADVLALTLLRGGETSDAWRDLRGATVAIVHASVMPTGSADPAFVSRVQEALGQVGYLGEDAALIAHQMANGRAADAGPDLSSRTELMVQLKARARLGEENTQTEEIEACPMAPAEQAALHALSTLAEPGWVELPDASGDGLVRRRLAWVGPRSGQALLLNRRSLRAGEYRLDTLARLSAAGRLHLVKTDLYPAEAAWQATREKLERFADEAQETMHGE